MAGDSHKYTVHCVFNLTGALPIQGEAKHGAPHLCHALKHEPFLAGGAGPLIHRPPVGQRSIRMSSSAWTDLESLIGSLWRLKLNLD